MPRIVRRRFRPDSAVVDDHRLSAGIDQVANLSAENGDFVGHAMMRELRHESLHTERCILLPNYFHLQSKQPRFLKGHDAYAYHPAGEVAEVFSPTLGEIHAIRTGRKIVVGSSP